MTSSPCPSTFNLRSTGSAKAALATTDERMTPEFGVRAARASAVAVETTAAATNRTVMRLLVMEAYDAYLRGRYLLEKRTGPATEKSVEYFEQAIKLDPN